MARYYKLNILYFHLPTVPVYVNMYLTDYRVIEIPVKKNYMTLSYNFLDHIKGQTGRGSLTKSVCCQQIHKHTRLKLLLNSRFTIFIVISHNSSFPNSTGNMSCYHGHKFSNGTLGFKHQDLKKKQKTYIRQVETTNIKPAIFYSLLLLYITLSLLTF